MLNNDFEFADGLKDCVWSKFPHDAHFINTNFGIVKRVDLEHALFSALVHNEQLCVYISTPSPSS
jgi:hypothetical protein